MKIFTIFIFLLFYKTVRAQVDPIDTDRPDQTESVNIVPKSWLQFEAGFSVQKTDNEVREFLTPTLLSKYGLSNRVELRLITSIITNSYRYTPQGTASSTGLDPVEIGAKIALWQQSNWIPKTSFLFHFAIPGFASRSNNIDLVAPNFRFTMQNSITKNLSVGYNLGAEWNGEERRPGYIYTVSPGLSFAEKWYGYIEAFGIIKKDESPQHSIDSGIAYNLTNNLKFDISCAFGITKAAPDWYLAIGISKRFKTK